MCIRRGPARGMKWITGSSVHGCWLGTYELEKQQALARFVRPGMTVYDIGAQAGFYTLFFSCLAGDAGQIYAFEPCPYDTHFIIDHVRMNGLANVHVIQAAVAERTELVAMSTDRGKMENRIGDVAGTPLIVSSLSLDSLDLPKPDLIKMDVEGAESAVLKGAQRVLREVRPVVFIALHSPEQSKICAAILDAADYRVYDLSGQRVHGIPTVDEIYAVRA